MLEGGYHFILDLQGCERRRLDSKRAMLRLCYDVARMMKTPVLTSGAHHFTPHGVTAFAVIAESHISVHTWPESGKAFLDVFTCRESVDGERLVEAVISALKAKRARLAVLLRGGRARDLILASRIPAAGMEIDFGRPIYRARSPFQTIELTRGPMGVSLLLDGYWQFVERYERIYHEVLAHPAMTCAPEVGRVGIGGGGDGLALREVLKYPQLGRVLMCELDPHVIELARTHPEMVRLNRRALDHPHARVRAQDARAMLRAGADFDVLIFDFPSVSDGSKFGPLYGTGIYRRARAALAPGGILVTQAMDWPRQLARTLANLREVFRHVLPVEVAIASSSFTCIVASDRPIRQRRALPPDCVFLSQDRLSKLLCGCRLSVRGTPARRRVA